MIDAIQNNLSVQSAGSVSSAKAVSEAANKAELPEAAPKNIDKYIPNEERESIGLYEVSPDEQGNSAVKFDAPKTERTTANTDNVDREIKALKERQAALQKALKSAAPEEEAELQKQLEEISAELIRKDNDQYRRANTVFS